MDTDSALRELVDDVAYKLRVTADNPSAHGGQPGLIVVMNEQAGRLESILAASASQQPAQAGMVLAPREPTRAMVMAGWDTGYLLGDTRISHKPSEVYAAMLAAAPPPTLNEAFDQVGAAMMREVCGDAAPAAQVAEPSEDHGCVYENGDGICRECADLAAASKAAAQAAELHGTSLRFGLGAWIVNTGEHDGQPCVFIDDAPERGEVGESAPLIATGTTPRLRLIFPTTEQAKSVADALVAAAPAVAVDEKAAIDRAAKAMARVRVPLVDEDGDQISVADALAQAFGDKDIGRAQEILWDMADDALAAALKGDA